MDLPPDILCIAEAIWDGHRAQIKRGEIAVVETDPIGDPAASACLALAATLLQKLSTNERSAAGIFLATRAGCLLGDIEFDRSRREADGRFVSPGAFRGT